MRPQDDRLRVDLDKHGLGPIESAIMDLYDGGCGFDAIAAKLGKTRTNVRDTVYRYNVNLSRDEACREAMARGSRELLKAQLRSGQHYLPPAAAQATARQIGLRPPLWVQR